MLKLYAVTLAVGGVVRRNCCPHQNNFIRALVPDAHVPAYAIFNESASLAVL